MLLKVKKFFARYRYLSGNVFALSLVSLLNDTSSEIIYPLLPTFLALTLGASPFYIGVIEGVAESVASVLKLFSGYLSDKFDKRKFPVFLGYALSSVVRPLLAFVGSWQAVFAVRLTDRIGKGIRGAPRDAILADSVAPEKRGLAFGFNRAADHLGAVIGPIIAFILLSYLAQNPEKPTAQDYSQVFLFASIPVVLGLFVIIFFVKEEKREPHETQENLTPIKLSLNEFDGNFKRFLITIALFTLSNPPDVFLLLRAEQAGVAPAVLPLLWMTLHFSKVIFSLIGGDLSDKFGRKTLIFTGWIIYALVYGGFAFVNSAWQAWVLFIIYGIYFGLTEGVEKALVADLVSKEKRGTAYGFYNLAFSITVLPASIIFGALWTYYGASTAFLFSAIISICAAILLLSVQTKNSIQPQ
ncbi:MAG TPA: MFS transporter [Pyrinomonadaceae bacterium]|nr:MFS transporter [Pyrinomonadaceae bacterium]